MAFKVKELRFTSTHKYLFGFALFLGAIFLYFQKVELHKKITQRPNGEHIWAQCDRASMAQTYYMDKAPFLLPRTYKAPNRSEGIAVGEFPLIPFLSAKLYSLFGFNEVYFRLLILITSISGFIFSYLIARKFIKHWFWSFFIASIWIASPNIIYYSFSFLPDITGLSVMLIALFFLIRKSSGPSYYDLGLFFIFFALAGLIRISVVVPLCAISAAYFICEFRYKIQDVRKKWVFIAGHITALAVVFSWLLYADYTNSCYKNFVFLLKPTPPLSYTELVNAINIYLGYHQNGYYYIKEFYYLLVFFTVISIVFIRNSNKFLLLSALFCYLGFFILFYIMLQKSYAHHYYWVPFQIGIFLHVLWIGTSLRYVKVNKFSEIIVGIASLIFINYNSINIHKNVNRKRWSNSKNEFSSYYNLESYLNKIGIGYDKRIASYPDVSFNNTLYFMNRKGNTLDPNDYPQNKRHLLSTTDYAVIKDTTVLTDTLWLNYLDKQVGQYEDIFIYSLKNQ